MADRVHTSHGKYGVHFCRTGRVTRILSALIFVLVSALLGGFAEASALPVALVAGLGAIAIVAIGRRDMQDRPSRTPPPKVADTEAAVILAISEPVLLVVDGRVRVANAAALSLLGGHVIGEDIRLAIRHPAAAQRLSSTAPDGSTELVGLGNRDQRVQMDVATLSPGRRVIHLIDRTTSYAAERARVDFVANSSHELRTPLAALIGFIETLDDENTGADPDVRNRFLAVMMKEARRMQRLIDDLISLSRIEAEKYSLPVTPVALGTLIEEVVSELRDEAGQPRTNVKLDIDEVVAIAGDRSQLSQVIHNLVGNAFKYGRAQSTVTIRLHQEGTSLIRLSIEDQGDGIAPEHLPRLTERFYRVDPGRSRTLGGTGLGLAIVKHIVERHRGRLDITSVVGSGTTVSVLLPVAVPAVANKSARY